MNTKRRFLLFSAIVVLCSLCFACSSTKGNVGTDAKIVKVQRSVSYFSKVELYGSPDVKFVQGKTAPMRIVGPKMLVDDVVVEQNGETLIIKQKSSQGNWGHKAHLTIYISSPDLTSIMVKGAGEFDVSGKLDTDHLDVTLIGSGDVDLENVIADDAKLRLVGSGDIKAKTIDVNIAAMELQGSGDMEIEQLKTNNANVTLKGSGDIKANLLKVKQTDVSLLGSGDVDIQFNDCASANCVLKGSGDIKLKGSLRSLSQNKSGSGDIHTDQLVVGK